MLLLAAFTSRDVLAQSASRAAVPLVVPTASELRVAAERFDEGRTAYKAGAFVEAAEHFEAADRHAPSASALGLAMRSRHEAGQLLRAANLAELVLVRCPEDTELIEKATAIIGAAAAVSGRTTVECEPACELVVDRRLSHGRAQRQWAVHVEPGPHSIVANWTGERVLAKQTSAAIGETSALAFRLDETTPSEPKNKELTSPERVPIRLPPVIAVDRKPNKLSPTWFWVGVGTTAIVGGVAVWSGIDTEYNPGPDAVKRGCVNQYESCPLYLEGQRKEVRTTVLFSATAVLAVATVVTGVFFTDFSRRAFSADARAGQVRPWVESRVTHDAVGRAGNGGTVTLVGAEGRF